MSLCRAAAVSPASWAGGTPTSALGDIPKPGTPHSPSVHKHLIWGCSFTADPPTGRQVLLVLTPQCAIPTREYPGDLLELPESKLAEYDVQMEVVLS